MSDFCVKYVRVQVDGTVEARITAEIQCSGYVTWKLRYL
jgi:hypothetical protein